MRHREQHWRVAYDEFSEAEKAHVRQLRTIGPIMSNFVRYADGSPTFGGRKTSRVNESPLPDTPLVEKRRRSP